MDRIDDKILNDDNYHSGLSKLVERNPEVWMIMVTEELIKLSGGEPTLEAYYYLCLLGQSKPPLLRQEA